MYNVLPETENHSLEEIELHFADNSKGLRDRKIRNKSNLLDDYVVHEENEAKLPILS